MNIVQQKLYHLDVLIDADGTPLLHLLHPHLVIGEAADVVHAPVAPHVHAHLPLLVDVDAGVVVVVDVESGVEDGRPSQEGG